MVCGKCGENNLENAKFCCACGAQMVLPASENPLSVSPRKFHVSKTMLLVAALVLVVVLLFFAVLSVRNLIGRESYVRREDLIRLHYRPEANRTLVDYNGKILDGLIDGDVKVGVRSQKGDVMAALSEDGALYLVRKDEVWEADRNVEEVIISYDGSFIIYSTLDYDAISETDLSTASSGEKAKLAVRRSLYRMEVKPGSKQRAHILSGCTGNYVIDGINTSCAALSPDGETFLVVMEEDGKFTTYVRSGSKSTVIEDFYGIFTSNDGKVVFGAKGCSVDTSARSQMEITSFDYFGVYNRKQDTVLKLADSIDDLELNNDHTEILFSSEGKLYLSADGGDRIKIGNCISTFTPEPRNAAQFGSQYVNSTDTFIGIPFAFRVEANADKAYGVGYIDRDYEWHKIVKNVGWSTYYDTCLSDDGNTVYYTWDDVLFSASRSDDFEPKLLTVDVKDYAMDASGDWLYYVSTDSELILLHNNKETKIADDISSTSLEVTADGTAYFISVDDILYCSKKGKKKVRIADDVDYVFSFPKHISYHSLNTSDGEDDILRDVYTSKDGKNFKRVVEDVE